LSNISKYTKRLILSSLLLGGSACAMSLEESILSAMDSNPVVQERLKNFRETQQDLKIANSEWLPKLDLISTAGVAEAGNVKSVVDDVHYKYYTNSLKLTQNIFNGFSTTYKVEYQEARILAAAHHYVENANDIAFQTVGAYIDLIRSYKLLQIAKESLEINQKIYEDVQELYDAGLTTSSEVTKIQSSLALAHSNVMVQQNNTKDKHFRLKRLLGRDLSLASLKLPQLNIAMPESMQRATMIAIQNNPSILVSNYNIKGAQALYHEGKSKFYPIVNFEVEQILNDSHRRDNGYEQVDDRSRAYLSLTWNLYNGGADSAALQKQRSNINKEIEIQRDLKRQVIEGLELSWSAYDMIKGQLNHLYSYKDFSEQTLDNYIEEYELGRRTLLDLLSAQNDLTNAKTEITNAEFDRLYAQYRILDAMGLLVETILGDTGRYDKYIEPIQKPFAIQKDTLPVNKDADNDTIVDTLDICDNSDLDTNLTPYGCEQKENDSDYDGVIDGVDQCEDTPIGVVVDERGCAIEDAKNRFENDRETFLSSPTQYIENSPEKSEDAGVYDYEYSFIVENNVASKAIDNTLMYEHFDVIKRFEAIDMHENGDEATDAIVSFYDTIKNENVIVTVIGHSGSKKDANQSANEYAQSVANILGDKGIDTHKLYTQARGNLDQAFLETECEDSQLNDRVLVTIYKPKTGLKDSDGDGVIDMFDRCKDTPKGVSVDADGCPLDSDGDGVSDEVDTCPNTPKGYEVDANGCVLKIDLEVTFGVNSTQIAPEAMHKVEAFAKFLNDNTDYKTTVTGHTSIAGNESRAYNVELSKKRAQSVKDALVKLGVDADRIKTVGKGPDEPIASNDTAEGRAQNRRIEATLEQDVMKANEQDLPQTQDVPSGWSL